jgi:RES domain
MDPTLANGIAGQDPVNITGSWQRHLPARYLASAMEGRQAYSRWGRDPGFPILYLGRPTASVLVEAYRNLVDPVDDPAIVEHLAPRVLVTGDVDVSAILDLRTSRARVELGLSLSQIQSATDDRAAYAACQEVAAAAHQHGFHGVIAPAATQLGESLALFSDRLPDNEVPRRTDEVLWDRLPDDPRGRTSHLRVVKP